MGMSRSPSGAGGNDLRNVGSITVMGVFNLARGRRDDRIAADAAQIHEPEKDFEVSGSASDSDTLSLEARNEKEVQQHPDQVTQDAGLGVKKAEATALVWSKPALYASFAWIWLCFFVLAFQQSIQTASSYKAYADFKTAPALTTAQILGSIIGGVIKLPIAKVLNIWGRAEGLLVFFGVYLLGIIVLASSNGPDSYAAGYVLYWIGYDAIYLILDIFVADTSGLKNRALSWAFVSTPFIITAFTGPLASQAYLAGSTWRWAIGSWAIITPFIFLPLIGVFKFYQRKAEKMGIFKKEDHGRTTMQSVLHYFHEFDIIGAILLMAAFVLFLLPFSLQSYGRASFSSATFIAMIVVGVLLFPVFAIWEKWFARKHFLRWELLRERTVLGACALSAISYYGFYSWDQQFYNFVKVVYALNVAEANYMLQIYNVGSTFWGVIFGVYVRWSKHFKYAVLFFSVPLVTLGAGLMIYFRGNDSPIGYVVMCQIFIAFGGGQNVIGQNMAVMAAADRDGVPMLLSLIYLFSSIGGAIGQAVATAIYANTFPEALSSRLPADLQGMVQTLYLGGYTTQEKYVPGTVLREATNFAWGRVQYYGCISATAIMVLAFPAVAVWKNYNVDKRQNKGTVI